MIIFFSLSFTLPPFLSKENKSHKTNLIFLNSHIYLWLLASWGKNATQLIGG